MALITTNDQYYKDLANTIRSHSSDKDAKFYPHELASAVDTIIYEDGYKHGEFEGHKISEYNNGAIDTLSQSKYMNATASGEPICLNDVNSIEHDVPVKVNSKNLLNPKELVNGSSNTTINGDIYTVTFTNQGKYINTNWTPSRTVFFEKGTYTMTILPLTDGFACVFYVYDENNNQLALKAMNATTTTFTFTTDKKFYPCVGGAKPYGTYDIKLQLEKGATATSYTPYMEDLSQVNVKRSGANLFNIGATDILTTSWSSQDKPRQLQENTWYIGLTSNNYWSSGSVLYSLNGDSIMVNPQTNGYCVTQAFRCKPNQKYYFSCEKSSSGIVSATFYDKSGNWINNAATNVIASKGFTVPDNCCWVTICFGGTRYVESTFSKVQLSLAPINEYEPYVEQTIHTANADGTVEGVKSISPSMTLMTDTEGTTIECSYLRDIDTYINNTIMNVALTGGE